MSGRCDIYGVNLVGYIDVSSTSEIPLRGPEV